MESIMALLPQAEGLLPKWIGLVGFVALINGASSYFSLKGTRRVYDSPTAGATPLASRLFGTWTFTNGLIRLYCAYAIHNAELYKLAMLSFVIAAAHFTGELLAHGTFRLNSASTPPFLVSTLSFVWMWSQWDYYLK